MFSRKTINRFDLDSLRFCGGSKMICGDKDIFFVCCALIAAIKGIEDLPLKKRSIPLNHMLIEWKRILASENEWMQVLERYQKEV